MPSIRIGFSTDFNLTNELVGIGTTNPTARLEVAGNIRAERLTGGGGITTLTRYDGFLHSQQNITNNISIAQTTKGNLNSLSGEIKIDGELTVGDGTPLTGGRLDSLIVTNRLSIPSGGTSSRELKPTKGSTRFNQDLGQLEFYTGYEWRTVSSYDGSGRGRGVFGGGSTPTRTAVIDFINIASTGNAINFGNLTVSRSGNTACSSPTRGLFGGGIDPGVNVNTIDYITIASEGNAIDFGDLLNAVRHSAGLSSTVIGIFGGGFSNTNVIQYIQINTLGNALDFGDLIQPVHGPGACASSTRGVFASGNNPDIVKTIQYITISSTGNAVNFGDLTQARGYASGSSNSTRGIFSNGFIPGTYSNTIDYITIASTGNAVDFGDTGRNSYGAQGCATSTRSIVAVGEFQSPAATILNVIEYIQINTTSNSFDFGDLTISRNNLGALSDSHGGLGGF